MTDNDMKFIDISMISKTAEMMETLLHKITEAECDSLPEINKKIIKLNNICVQHNITETKVEKNKAFDLVVDIESQIFEQLGYTEEIWHTLKDVIENLDGISSVLYTTKKRGMH